MNKKLLAAGVGVVGLIGAGLSGEEPNPDLALKTNVVAVSNFAEPEISTKEIKEIVIETPKQYLTPQALIITENPPEKAQIEAEPPAPTPKQAIVVEQISTEPDYQASAPVLISATKTYTAPKVKTITPQPVATSTPKPTAKSNCDPNYSGCIPLGISDADCASGKGNGPYYVDYPVQILGRDPHRLDGDKDGWGCENE